MTTLAAGPVQDALSDVARFVPKFLAFLVILLLGWLAARLLRPGVTRVLKRVGFDRAAERGGVGRLLARTRYHASGLMAALAYYAVLLFTLQLAFGIWGPNPVSDLISGIVAWLPKAAVAIIIVVVAAAIASGVRDIIAAALGGLSYGRLLAGAASAVVVGIGVIAALDQIGVATAVTTPVLVAILATIAGILVVGVGGGLVRPMQARWESWLNRIEEEVPEAREKLRVAAEERETARREAEETAARREAEEAARRAAEQAAREDATARLAAAERAEAARLEEPATSTGGPRTARERAEQAAARRAAADAGTLPQASPSDEPTMAISVEAVQAAVAAAKDSTPGDAAARTGAEQTQAIEWPPASVNPEDDSVRTQALPTTEPPGESPSKPARGRGSAGQ